MIWLLLLSGAFVAGGVMMIMDGDPMGWFCGGFFAIGFLVFAVQMHPRASYLTVMEDGFEFSALFRKTRCSWSDIAAFGTYTLRQKGLPVGTFVGIDYVSDYKGASKVRSISKALAGFEGGLPDTYGMKAAELALLLQHYHAEYMKRKRSKHSQTGLGS